MAVRKLTAAEHVHDAILALFAGQSFMYRVSRSGNNLLATGGGSYIVVEFDADHEQRVVIDIGSTR